MMFSPVESVRSVQGGGAEKCRYQNAIVDAENAICLIRSFFKKVEGIQNTQFDDHDGYFCGIRFGEQKGAEKPKYLNKREMDTMLQGTEMMLLETISHVLNLKVNSLQTAIQKNRNDVQAIAAAVLSEFQRKERLNALAASMGYNVSSEATKKPRGYLYSRCSNCRCSRRLTMEDTDTNQFCRPCSSKEFTLRDEKDNIYATIADYPGNPSPAISSNADVPLAPAP